MNRSKKFEEGQRLLKSIKDQNLEVKSELKVSQEGISAGK